MMVKSHKLIALKYFKSGWFFIDILGTLPFQMFEMSGFSGYMVKLIRLVRIPRIIKVFNAQRFMGDIAIHSFGNTRA